LIELTIWHGALLYFVGVFVGITNVLAGGGSLITIPLLIFFGLDGASANGTNRLAIAIQNVFAVAGFKKKGICNPKFSLMLILPALPGVILGAVTASHIGDQMFRRVLSVVMIVILTLILTRKKSYSDMRIDENNLSKKQRILVMIAFAGIGFYSGFIQAGVGFITIIALTSITGLDLVRTNAHKVFVIGVLTWIAVFIFIYYGKIVWSLSLILASGTATGGWIGSHFAVAGGEKWIKRVLTVAVIAMAIKLMEIF